MAPPSLVGPEKRDPAVWRRPGPNSAGREGRAGARSDGNSKQPLPNQLVTGIRLQKPEAKLQLAYTR